MNTSLYVNINGVFELATKEYVVDSALSLLSPKTGEVISSKDALVNFLRLRHGDSTHETFGVIYLDTQLRVIEVQEFKGTVDSVLISPRIVMENVLRAAARNVIIYHNHPSGLCAPSLSDIKFTITLKSALETIDVALCDHIIVSSLSHHSMRESQPFFN